MATETTNNFARVKVARNEKYPQCETTAEDTGAQCRASGTFEVDGRKLCGKHAAQIALKVVLGE